MSVSYEQIAQTRSSAMGPQISFFVPKNSEREIPLSSSLMRSRFAQADQSIGLRLFRLLNRISGSDPSCDVGMRCIARGAPRNTNLHSLLISVLHSEPFTAITECIR